MTEYDSLCLCKDAYKIKCNSQKWLPPYVYKFHELTQREVNAAVELQIGVLLPFISSICGPLMKGHFLTRPSCIDLFWINIAALGVGKSQSRQCMKSEPLTYMLQNLDHLFQDFEVSKYTRAGTQF